jgi:HSP20 family protein
MNPTPNIFSEHLLTNLSQLGEARIYEEKDQLHVELPVPGLTLKDIDVTMKNGVLIVKGEAKEEEKDKKRKYYRSSSRSYSYSLSLPTQIDEKQEPHASYEHGILNISMKLAKASETKKITVKARNGKK